MSKVEARRVRRSKESAKVREERVITEYVKIKHPEIYAKATTFYDKLNELHPKKPDLRKAKEFYPLLTGIPLNTASKKRYTEKVFPNINKTDPQLETPLLAVRLEIPLLPPQPTTPAESPPAVPATSPPPESPPAVPAPPTATSPPEPTTENMVCLPHVDDETLNQIIVDLQNDPFLNDFFDDLELNEISPLEEELHAW